MERWNSKILLILAVAGGAIGIGNFLRFPTLFAQYGGWFLVPYFVSFFLLGLPLMIIEWTLGAIARDKGQNSLATLIETMWPKNKYLKYFGVLCVACCLVIAGYYMYVESWMLGYSIISLKGTFSVLPSNQLGDFLNTYIGFKGDVFLKILCIISLVITVFLNFYFVAKGISKGVGVLIKWSMPILLIMSVLMLVKVFFTPNIVEGIKYMFRGNITDIFNIKMWLDAASQMFFSLSVGFSATMVYVTYSKNNLNILKDGLVSSFMNMGIEILIASFIAIPVSYLVLGDKMDEVAHSSSIAFGMVTMPTIFHGIPGGAFWSFIWFFLLFIAALTSSVSIVQVFVSFIKNKLNCDGVKSAFVNLLCFLVVIIATVTIDCAIDEFDFWTNSIFMPIGALILIGFVYGLKNKFVEEINDNSERKIPKIVLIVIKYVTPVYLLGVMIPFIVTNGKDFLMGKDVSLEKWVCRGIIVLIIIVYGIIMHKKTEK